MLLEKSKIPKGKSGDWKVNKFFINKKQADNYNTRLIISFQGHRRVEPGKYTRLVYKNEVVMSDTPAELRDHAEFVVRAKGNVLINGLGLGIATLAVLNKKEVDLVVVNEISKDVIKLVAPYLPKDKRLILNNADAFTWYANGTRFNTIWHDIWIGYGEDQYQESIKLHRRYSNWLKKPYWQGSWGRKDFLRDW